ncbi:MAG: hypothetical protein GVY36_02220 [Verrucomicrobia bacterium]|nr:hypothetical protein [Verrucomicrobiota bacterium]
MAEAGDGDTLTLFCDIYRRGPHRKSIFGIRSEKELMQVREKITIVVVICCLIAVCTVEGNLAVSRLEKATIGTFAQVWKNLQVWPS